MLIHAQIKQLYNLTEYAGKEILLIAFNVILDLINVKNVIFLHRLHTYHINSNHAS